MGQESVKSCGHIQQVIKILCLGLVLFLRSPAFAEEPGQLPERDFGINYVGSFGGKISAWTSHGDLYYVGQGDTFRILKNSGDLKELGSLRIDGTADSITMAGSVVFLSIGSEVLHVDVTNPSQPVSLGNLRLDNWYRHYKLVIRDSQLLVNGGSRVDIFNIDNPLKPVHKKMIYLNDNATTLTNIFREDKSATASLPIMLSRFQVIPDAVDVQAMEDKAFVLDRAEGLYIFDISNPHSPKLLGSCKLPGKNCHLAISKSYAITLAGGNEFCMIDIGNPASPILKYSGQLASRANAIATYDNYSYFATDSGLEVFDIHTAPPVHLLKLELKGVTSDVKIFGALAFVESGGTHILDLRDPKLPVNIHYLELALPPDYSGGGGLEKVSASSEYIGELNYLDPGNLGQCIITDIKDINAPKTIGNTNISSEYELHLTNCLVVRNQLSIAWSYHTTGGVFNGITAYDLSKGTKVIVGSFSMLEDLVGLSSYGEYILIADGTGGLVVLK